MNLYVGNLSFKTTDASLQELFQAHGQVQSARVVMDRDSGRSKGFGFVEMSNNEEATAAINALNGTDLDGRIISAGFFISACHKIDITVQKSGQPPLNSVLSSLKETSDKI